MEQIPEEGTLTTAPPPPTEVKVRTMRSDIAMMTASGGGVPKFENVRITGLSAKKETIAGAARTESKSNLLLSLILVIVFVAVIVVGWLVYKRFGS